MQKLEETLVVSYILSAHVILDKDGASALSCKGLASNMLAIGVTSINLHPKIGALGC